MLFRSNGEHLGGRGVNAIVAAAFETPDHAAGRYLPGLAGGGVQLQDRHGAVTHPGISDHELDFLRAVPERATRFLAAHLSAAPYRLEGTERSEEHTSELQSLMRISYAVFCL